MGKGLRLAAFVSIALVSALLWYLMQPRRSPAGAVQAASNPVQATTAVGAAAPDATVRRAVVGAHATTAEIEDLPRRDAPLLTSYAELSARAEAGDIDSAIRLTNDLERCLRHREAQGEFSSLQMFPDALPKCDTQEDCRRAEATYDQYQASLADLKQTLALCRDVPLDWIEHRGHWLQRAAEAGDSEARACYAAAGAEIGPSAERSDGQAWMDHWHQHALAWAWDAWNRGDARAAVALARSYASEPLWFADAQHLAEPDPALEYRFATFMTRFLQLDAQHDDLARIAQAGAESLDVDTLARENAVVAQLILQHSARPVRPSRMPDRCWGNFAGYP